MQAATAWCALRYTFRYTYSHYLLGVPRYPFLSYASAVTAIPRLLPFEYLYHATPSKRARLIASSGIDPAEESDESAYWDRAEPKAMRFAKRENVEVALGTAWTRCATEDPACSFYYDDSPVLLRVPASAVFSRPFGLDHSFVPLAEAFTEVKAQRGVPLSAADFLALAHEHGSLSCYARIPARMVEVSTVLSTDGPFVPLTFESVANVQPPT